MRLLPIPLVLVNLIASVTYGTLLLPKELIHTHILTWRLLKRGILRRRDLVSSGNFEIASCGAQAPFIIEALHQTHDLLLEAIDSLPPPIGSGSGLAVYNAFFKHVSPTVVKDMYQRIADGTNVTIRGLPFRPTIICSKIKDPRFVHILEYCTPRSNDVTIGIYLDNSPMILLCPIWSHIPNISLPHMCGTVNSTSVRLSYPYSMSMTKYHTLVHELAHLYIGSALRPEDEVYEVNDCMALPAGKAAINPQNYAYYASYLKAGCTDFPIRHPNTQELHGNGSRLTR